MHTKKSFSTYVINLDSANLTVEEYLKNILHYSSRKRQLLTRNKGIYLNRKTTFMKRQLKESDILRVMDFPDISYGVTPQNQKIDILYEDEHVIVLNKPPKLLTHPTGQTTNNTLANYLAYYFQSKQILSTIRPMHRLDRDTSGCIVFAKSAHSQTLLTKQLEHQILKRFYLAITEGCPQEKKATINRPIAIHPSFPNQRITSSTGETAITHYEVIENLAETHSLLSLSLETGRTHQIRVHLASVGLPILGDSMYGKKSNLISHQSLHAAKVQFNHIESNRKILVQAPMPKDMNELLIQLRK